MVLWSNLERNWELASAKSGRDIRKVRRSEQGKRRRGFKPDAAAGSTKRPERDHIRLRGVGFAQYRKSPGIPQAGARPEVPCIHPPQNGFTTTRMTMPIMRTVGTSLITRYNF
jgi:hypothetical protein